MKNRKQQIFFLSVFVRLCTGPHGRMARSRQANTDERDRMDDPADTLAEVQRRRGQRVCETQIGDQTGRSVVRAGIVN